MKIARWSHAGSNFEGFIIDGRAVAFPQGVTVATLLAEGLGAARAAYSQVTDEAEGKSLGVSLDQVTLRTPLDAASVRDFVAFEEHVEGVSGSVDGKNEVVDEWYQAPTFYFTNPHTLRADGEIIDIPETNKLDFELEVAVIITGTGSNLDASSARDHIFGYAIFNDWSARDLQSREMKVRLGPCKGKDFAATLGPWIVTADELDPFIDEDGFLAVRAEAYINGELVGDDLVSNMGWPLPELVAYASRNSIVVPGDVLGSGTIGHGGCLGELWGLGSDIPALQPGDEVRLVVEGIGEINNRIGQRISAPEVLPARTRPRHRYRQS